MVELKNITKIYKGKGNSSVKALDNVSFVLPDRGLVFILGKSGCGKSTLLNIAGGLDKPTHGEIIIKGKSSKKFSSSDFDSYRNTHIGFIFQEYNVLPEFSISENVTLATELQGKKPQSEETNAILKEVELEGLEKRKPTTLSGGQKQRVAIARALVKDPQIIFADEPTGALDSATGKAVLDLLKRLSENKLVVVVSHDRDFANRYADRIIELSDGKVISDLSFVKDEEKNHSGMTVVGDNVHLEKDIDAAMLEELNTLLRDRKKLTLTLEEGGVSVKGGHFAPTKEENIRTAYDPNEKLIRSKFPLKYAARIGASGLRTKRFRLVLTILISTIALAAFGFMLTLMSFDETYAIRRALEEDTAPSELGVADYRIRTFTIPIVNMVYESTQWQLSSSERIAALERSAEGVEFLRVHCFSSENSYGYFNNSFRFSEQYSDFYSSYYPTELCGFATSDEAGLERFGCALIKGHMPQSDDEVLISDLIAEAFYNSKVRTPSGQLIMDRADADPTGKQLTLYSGDNKAVLTICGVFSAPRPNKKFDEIKSLSQSLAGIWETESMNTVKELEKYYQLSTELNEVYHASLSTIAFVADSFYDRHYAALRNSYDDNVILDNDYHYYQQARISDLDDKSLIYIDGKKQTENAVFVTYDYLTMTVENLRSSGAVSQDYFYDYYDKLNSIDSSENGRSTLSEIINDLYYKSKKHFESIQMYTKGSSKIVNICGVVMPEKIQDEYDEFILYFTDKLYKELFGSEDIYNASSADFLLCRNTSEAREALTGSEIRQMDENDRRFMIFSNYQSDSINDYARTIVILSGVFFWVGVVIALFASLLLFNFISASINYKKKDIGILRALGARKVDVFKVFYSESMMIIGICYLLSVIFTIILSISFNNFLKEEFLLSSSLFFFGPLQALILGALASGVAFISTILPVIHYAKKPPVDAIRAL